MNISHISSRELNQLAVSEEIWPVREEEREREGERERPSDYIRVIGHRSTSQWPFASLLLLIEKSP